MRIGCWKREIKTKTEHVKPLLISETPINDSVYLNTHKSTELIIQTKWLFSRHDDVPLNQYNNQAMLVEYEMG